MASQRIMWGLFAAFFANSGHAQMRLPLAGPNPVDVVRNAADFQFYASLFPQAGTAFNPDYDQVMSPPQVAEATGYLAEEFAAHKRTLAAQSRSVWGAIKAAGADAIKPTSAARTRLTFKDDQQAWSTTVSPTEIVLGARLVRGLLLGGLRESATGLAGFSQSLGAYLGATPNAQLSNQDLESRARLFFAAARQGVSVPRSEEDFTEHRRVAITLLDQLRGVGGDRAIHSELERRLKSAAAGGEINGADGMAIFDVFMRLSSHVQPAVMFVMSHELGHVALGHAPFSDGLTCAERQHREDDADDFAISLLVYDVPGELEANATALYRIGVGERPDPDDDTLAYGYTHAVRYGFALGGLDNTLEGSCRYRSAADRVARLNAVRARLVARRIEAFEITYRYFRAHPPYVYAEHDVDGMSARERATYAKELFIRCQRGPSKGRMPRLRKLYELPFGWVVPCFNVTSPLLRNADFASRLGVTTAQKLSKEYMTGRPILLDDSTIKALLTP
jgi:Zn-dependent protease with chaperone function